MTFESAFSVCVHACLLGLGMCLCVVECVCV